MSIPSNSFTLACYLHRCQRVLSYRSLSFIAALSLSSLVQAWDYSLSFDLGTRYSNNASLATQAPERDDLETRLGAQFGLEHQGSAIVLDSDYRAQYSDFKNDVIETDNQITGDTSLLWNIIDRSFSWQVNHSISEALANNGADDTADGRETRQIISTGPRFNARLSKVDNLNLALDYTQLTQDNSELEEVAAINGNDTRINLDSDRQQARLSWSRALSKISGLELVFSHAETEFKDNSPDAEFQQYYLGYNVQLASGEYSIQIGANQAERDSIIGGNTINSDNDGLFANINFSREFSSQRIAIVAKQELTDSSIGFGIADASQAQANAANANFDQIDIVERSLVQLTYQIDQLFCQSCQWSIGLIYDKEDFQSDDQRTVDALQSSEEQQATVDMLYRINSNLSASVGASYSEADFDSGQTDETVTARVGLRNKLSDQLAVRLTLSHEDDESTNASGQTASYDELEGILTFVYTVK